MLTNTQHIDNITYVWKAVLLGDSRDLRETVLTIAFRASQRGKTWGAASQLPCPCPSHSVGSSVTMSDHLVRALRQTRGPKLLAVIHSTDVALPADPSHEGASLEMARPAPSSEHEVQLIRAEFSLAQTTSLGLEDELRQFSTSAYI